MNKNRVCWMGVGAALIGTPAVANQVIKNDLKDMQDFTHAPMVYVDSSDGEKWDKIDKERLTQIRLGYEGECLDEDSAYLGGLSVVGFYVPSYAPNKGNAVHHVKYVQGVLRWKGVDEIDHSGFDPIASCNAELERRLSAHSGASRYELLAQGFIINSKYVVQADYTLSCLSEEGKTEYFDNPSATNTDSAWVNVRIACQGSAEAKNKIPPTSKPKPKKVQLVGPIKDVKLKLNPANYQGRCPATVKIDGTLTLNYPAEIKYQYIGDAGYKSPVFKLRNKGTAGSWNLVSWSRRIEPPSTFGKLAIGPKTGGYKHQGWMKVRILSPKPRDFKAATFKVQCLPGPQAVPGKLAPPKPRPEPKGLKLKTGSQAIPARTHKPTEIVIVGSKVKKQAEQETDGRVKGVIRSPGATAAD